MKNQHFLLFLLLALISFTGKGQDLKKSTDDLSIQIEKKDASKSNTDDAFIKIKVLGGVAPYRITYFSPYEPPKNTVANELNLMNIKSGDYFIVVRDASGKTITKDVIIINQR